MSLSSLCVFRRHPFVLLLLSQVLLCFSSRFSSSPLTPVTAQSATRVNLQAIELLSSIDSGSFFAIEDLTKSYTLVEPDLSFSLSQYGSSVTIDDMLAQTIDFGVVLGSMTDVQVASGPSLALLPFMLTGLVPTYKLSALPHTAPPLVLSRLALAHIYEGVITTWNHPLITIDNPALTLPNQSISVLLDINSPVKTLLIKQAISSFDASGFNASGMTVSTDNDFPTQLYANYAYIASGITDLVSATEALDGSISINFAAVAASLGISVASMINRAGTTVQPTPEAYIFAAIEKGTNQLSTRTSVSNLMDATSSSAWTMTVPSYFLIDSLNTRTTCKSKTEAVLFFLYIYQSPVAASVLAQRGYALLPDVIVSELDVINFLSTSVLCEGSSVVPTAETIERSLGVTSSLSFVSNLITSIYVSQDSMVTWQAFSSDDSILVEKMVASELDLSFVNLANVDADLLSLVSESKEFLMLPTFAIALNVFFNPQISPTLNIAGQILIVDDSILTQLVIGCITDYSDPQLLALNPWLSSLLQNQSVPITQILGCAADGVYAPITTYVLEQVFAAIQLDPTSLDNVCPNWLQLLQQLQDNVASCTNVLTGDHLLQFASPETTAPALVLGVLGAFGLIAVVGDPNKVFPLVVTQNQTIGENQLISLASSSTSGILECTVNTFQSEQLSFNLSANVASGCGPFTLAIVTIMRTKYYSTTLITNSSSCSRGYDALSFMSWLLQEAKIGPLVAASNVVQLNVNSQVITAYNNAIDAVLCDDKTLFITLPDEWNLGKAVYEFALFASSLGLAYVACLASFVILYRNHAIMRASSPIFVLISLFGVALLFGGIIALVSPVTTDSCNAVAWLMNLGLMIAYAPLFVKAWRIYSIFSRRKLHITKITNGKLLVIVLMLLSLEILLLGTWQGVGPLQPLLTVDASQVSGVPDNDYLQCGVEGVGGLMLALIGVEKGLLFGCGALVSFATRKVVSNFNESSQIAVSIYFALFSIAIVAPVVIVIKAKGDILIALLLLVALLIAYFVSSMLVIPKTIAIFGQDAEAALANIVSKSNASLENFSFIPLEQLSSLNLISSYLNALQAHQGLVKMRQAALMRRCNPNNEKEKDKPVHVPVSSKTSILTTNFTRAPSMSIVTSKAAKTVSVSPTDDTNININQTRPPSIVVHPTHRRMISTPVADTITVSQSPSAVHTAKTTISDRNSLNLDFTEGMIKDIVLLPQLAQVSEVSDVKQS